MNQLFWEGKRVFITGNTGFKGSWLSLWFNLMGAKVSGYALKPANDQYLFGLCRLGEIIPTCFGDIDDCSSLSRAIQEAQPEIVIHMAAQPLVRESYKQPVLTYRTNVLGTVHLLEAVRNCASVKAVINVTTDKCYQNREWIWGYRENDPLGGYDPYSSSKACSEMVTTAYRNSFFAPESYLQHGVAIASVRAGNVIGGGDWAEDRLIPDIMRALLSEKTITIRYPHSIRPWQYVLEPLAGYIMLAEKLYREGPQYGGGWNFGPEEQDLRTVEWIVEYMFNLWGSVAGYVVDSEKHLHEAGCLKLDCSKAREKLGWVPRWHIETALKKTIEWFKGYHKMDDMRQICYRQIEEYTITPAVKDIYL
jgi:CDP-glucose 4,6-dehydratase